MPNGKLSAKKRRKLEKLIFYPTPVLFEEADLFSYKVHSSRMLDRCWIDFFLFTASAKRKKWLANVKSRPYEEMQSHITTSGVISWAAYTEHSTFTLHRLLLTCFCY